MEVKEIPGWPGYFACDLGYIVGRRGWVLKPCLDADGYPRVDLRCKELGIRRTWPVHQLILLTFRGERPEGMESRHIDGVYTNCKLTNLEYATKEVNEQDKRRHGTHHYGSRTECSNGHEYTTENTRFVTETKRGKVYTRRRCNTCDNKHPVMAGVEEEKEGN